MFRFFFILLTICFSFGEPTITISGEINIAQNIDSLAVRTCPDYIDSCLYICSDGTANACHPEQLYPIDIDTETNTNDSNLTTNSHYRIYFPWENNNLTADKFVVTASWPCLSPTAVYASGNYVYWDIYGNDHCPGTVQGVIWYGDDCEDESGNIGSDDCSHLVGRFCFVAGDTLEWPVEADQSISSDICDACWMSEPAWNDYDSQQYSDPSLFPEYCEEFDHCHHSTPEDINCGIGYLDETDSTSVNIKHTIQIPQLFSISNYPNPFNPMTTINFSLTQDTYLNIVIQDIMGRQIKRILSENQLAGQNSIQWDGTNNKGETVSAGIYFYSIEAEGYLETKKMILLK